VISGAIAAIAMIGAEISPAAALTLPSPAGMEKAVSPQVEKTYWCRWGCGWRGGWGWRRPWGWGWGRPWGWGWAPGVAAGAVVASSCWRRVLGPYGWHWVRVC
jgi:hypothetical protein